MGFARETMDFEAPAGATRMLESAKFPNVSVKVSAMPCFSTDPYPFKNLHDPIRRVIDGFGVRNAAIGARTYYLASAVLVSRGRHHVHRGARPSVAVRPRMGDGQVARETSRLARDLGTLRLGTARAASSVSTPSPSVWTMTCDARRTAPPAHRARDN